MNHLFSQLEQIDGEKLRNLLKMIENIKNGNVTIAGPIAKDYEKYQVKNHPNTIDIAATVVMGAPFPIDFRNILKDLIEKLKHVFQSYDVKLHVYADDHIHATVSPLIRTTFDPYIYLNDPITVNKKQREEIRNKALDLQQIKKEIALTRPFRIELYPWNINIGDRGEILLWGEAKDDDGKKELSELRKRLIKIAESHARDKGYTVHIALATIEGFHKLTGLNKKEIAGRIFNKLDSVPIPSSIYIDHVRFVQYLHRNLSKVEITEKICFS